MTEDQKLRRIRLIYKRNELFEQHSKIHKELAELEKELKLLDNNTPITSDSCDVV
jgi:hypothetical protein